MYLVVLREASKTKALCRAYSGTAGELRCCVCREVEHGSLVVRIQAQAQCKRSAESDKTVVSNGMMV